MASRRSPLTPVSTNVRLVPQSIKETPDRDEEIDALCGLVSHADLLNDALTSHKKANRRSSFAEVPSWELNFQDDTGALSYSSSEEEDEFGTTLTSLKTEVRDSLMKAMLQLINDPSTDEARLKNVLAGIGPIRARMLCETRDQRVHKLFDSVPDALAAVGLSARQIDNLIIANMRQILHFAN